MTMATMKASIRPWLRSAAERPAVRGPLLGMARHGVLPRAIWRRLPVERTFRVGLGGGASFLYRATPEDVIGRGLYWRGAAECEPETVAVFARLAGRSRVVLDIGANTGLYSLIACAVNPDARVTAFEPVPRTHARLAEHVALNGWAGRCEARAQAVADALGTARFHVPAEALPTSASLHAGGFRGKAGELIEVPVTTIDSAVPEGVRVDLAKIDVEGFEDKVLLGMARVLADSRPDLIVECNADGPHRAVEAILRPFGYRFFHLRAAGPAPAASIVPDAAGHARNYLCTARDDGAEARGS